MIPAKRSSYRVRLLHNSEPLRRATSDIERVLRQLIHSPAHSSRSTGRRSELTVGASRPSKSKRLPNDYDNPWLENRFDAVLVTNSTVSSQSSPYDWRNRAVSRKSLYRNAQISTTTKTLHLKPKVRRERVQEPSVKPDDPLYERVIRYRQHFLPLLEAEKTEQHAVLNTRLQTWSLERLQSEGYCIQEMRAFWLDATVMGKPVASFSLGVGQELPSHVFRVGDDAYISRNGPLAQGQRVYIGQVTSVSPTRIAIAFECAEELKGHWRLDVGCSDTAFRRMAEAINSFLYHPEVQIRSAGGMSDNIVLRGTYLQDVLLRTEPLKPHSLDSKATREVSSSYECPEPTMSGLFLQDMRLRSWCLRHTRADPIAIDGDPTLLSLNRTQIRAIAMMLMERVSLVQGPPGTGKTKTIIEAIRLLKAHFAVPQPILVCTYTNAAVDHLVEGLTGASQVGDKWDRDGRTLKPLRIGFSSDPSKRSHRHNFLAKIEGHPMKVELDKLQLRIDKLQDILTAARAKLHAVTEKMDSSHQLPRELSMTKKKKLKEDVQNLSNERMVKQSIYFSLYRQMTYDICHDSDVICTTCIASACFALTVLDFPVVFLDEASMSAEPASLIPIMKGSRHIALIGDHKQLPPVIVSDKAKEGGLSISLFERLMESRAVPSIMLDIQYRMHPGISSFPSAEFYDFNLVDGTVDASGKVASSRLPPNSSHLKPDATGSRPSVIFLSHEMPECPRHRSRANDGEALLVVGIIEDLLRNNPDMRGEDIGVIAPYVAQTSTLRNLLWTDAGIQEHLKLSLGQDRASETGSIEVKTVDGFEGREKEVVIFSTVRNNSTGQIGFLADRRRLNVGLTRAKRALFVLGSSRTLSATKVPLEWTEGDDRVREPRPILQEGAWQKYLRWLERHELVIVLSGQALRQAMGKRVTAQTV